MKVECEKHTFDHGWHLADNVNLCTKTRRITKDQADTPYTHPV